MLYSEEVFDRRTGELITISKGEWITVTELADLYGVGPRKARCVLRELDFLTIEGSRDHARHRIQPWAVARGYGRRNKAKAGRKIPFDVISPEGRDWIDAGWAQALEAVELAASGSRVGDAGSALRGYQESRGREDMPVHEAVSWLMHHFPDMPHADMGSILEVSQQIVSRYVSQRVEERRKRGSRKKAEVPDLGKIQQRGLSAELNYEPFEVRR